MNAGNLNTKIIVEMQTAGRDSYGSTTVVWSTRCALWGKVKPLPGYERWDAERVVGSVPIRIYARYRSDVELTDRLEMGGKYYYVSEVEDVDGRKREMQITAKRVE